MVVTLPKPQNQFTVTMGRVPTTAIKDSRPVLIPMISQSNLTPPRYILHKAKCEQYHIRYGYN